MINKTEYERVFLEAVELYRKFAPKDTGNLAYNAIKYRWENGNQFVIYVDVGDVGIVKNRVEGIAPYMPYTNEKWISPRWNGKPNPNENWWNNASEFVINYIASRLGGKLK